MGKCYEYFPMVRLCSDKCLVMMATNQTLCKWNTWKYWENDLLLHYTINNTFFWSASLVSQKTMGGIETYWNRPQIGYCWEAVLAQKQPKEWCTLYIYIHICNIYNIYIIYISIIYTHTCVCVNVCVLLDNWWSLFLVDNYCFTTFISNHDRPDFASWMLVRYLQWWRPSIIKWGGNPLD